jgi:hypothetical protein
MRDRLSRVQLLILGIYTLVFSLPDLLGDERTKALETWWLDIATRAIRLLIRYARPTAMFLAASLGTTALLMLAYAPLFAFVLVPPITAPRFELMRYPMPPRSRALLFLLAILLLFPAIGVIVHFVPRIPDLTTRILLKGMGESLSGLDLSSMCRSSLPIEMRLCIRFISYGKALDRNRLLNRVYSGTGVVVLLVFMACIVAILAIFGLLWGRLPLAGPTSAIGLIMLWAFLLAPCLYLFPGFLALGTISLVNSLTLMSGSLIRIALCLICTTPWLVLFAPSIFLNRIARLTGQPRFFKVGKYLLLIAGIVASLVGHCGK